MKTRIKIAGALFAIAVLLACGSSEPTPVPTPSPTPSPTPTPVAEACLLETVIVTPSLDQDGERNTPKFEYGTAQTVLLRARPVNARLAFIDENCPNYSLVTRWLALAGGTCGYLGSTNTPSVRFRCLLPADVLIRVEMEGSDRQGNRIRRTGEAAVSIVEGASALRPFVYPTEMTEPFALRIWNDLILARRRAVQGR